MSEDLLFPPLDTFSTEEAKAVEKERRKVRQLLLEQWKNTHAQTDADAVAAIEAISDEEWNAAQAQDVEGVTDAA